MFDRDTHKKTRFQSVGLFLLLALLAGVASADWNTEYQFGVDFEPPPNDPHLWTKTSAFLWLPPKAQNVRAVLLAPANIIERRFCDDPIIREMAVKNSLALVFFQPGWKGNITSTRRLLEVVDTILDALATKSGHDELRTVPCISIGHSGNSGFVEAMGRLRPERTLASIVIKGKAPTPDRDGNKAGLLGIPILFITGEFEEVGAPGGVRNAWWGVQMNHFADTKSAVPQALVTGMMDRGFGHLNWFEELSKYAAMYIDKAMNTRLDKAGKLQEVKFESGWLSDPDGVKPAAPVSQYTGDPAKAFWHFDEEATRAWQKIHERDKGKKEQLLAFTRDGAIIPFWNGWSVQGTDFRLEPDGLTFKVEAAFRDEVPKPFADAGVKVGHSAQGPIQYSVLGWAGATEQTGANTFRIRFDREGINGRTLGALLGAMHPGDAEYRATMASVRFDIAFNKGRPQSITFPQPANVKAGTASMPLNATVNSGQKPDYYVSWGPAVVDGENLKFTEIPAKAKFPVEVRVSAYQWGKSTEPKFASSNLTQRTFYIVDGSGSKPSDQTFKFPAASAATVATAGPTPVPTPAPVKSSVTFPTNLPKLSGAMLWFSADSGVIRGATGEVSAWLDMSSNQVKIAPAAETSGPMWVAEGINKKPVFRFEGSKKTNLMLKRALSGLSGDMTVYVVWAAPGKQEDMIQGGVNNRLFSASAMDGMDYDKGITIVTQTSEPVMANVTEQVVQGKAQLTGIGLGGMLDGQGGMLGFFATADIAEVVVCLGKPGAEEANALKKYFLDKYGVK